MKTRIFKNISLSIISVLIVSSVVYGALGWWEWVENADTWESLTATVWNSLVDGVVKKTGSVAETITGIKTFSSSPIVPTPTWSTEVANKGYVDWLTAPDKPVFRSYRSGNQGISWNVETIVQFNAEDYDPKNEFNTGNYRYIPQKAWYYSVNLKITFSVSDVAKTEARIYKNTSLIWIQTTTGRTNVAQNITDWLGEVVYMNGTTDYLQWRWFTTGGWNMIWGSSSTNFSAFYIGD